LRYHRLHLRAAAIKRSSGVIVVVVATILITHITARSGVAINRHE
jgi:hypothetical protein